MDLFKAIAPFFCVLIVFWIAARVAVADAAKDRTATERENGRIEFFPNRQCFWGIYVILAFISYPILVFIATGFKSPVGLWLVSLCSGCIPEESFPDSYSGLVNSCSFLQARLPSQIRSAL